MTIGTVGLIILLVLGVVVGNLMLLRHSAKMPFKQPNKSKPDDKTAP